MAVICQAYVEGVSTRRVDDLVKAHGIDGISKSEVSRIAAELDTVVTEFRERPLDDGPYRYLWIDALGAPRGALEPCRGERTRPSARRSEPVKLRAA